MDSLKPAKSRVWRKNRHLPLRLVWTWLGYCINTANYFLQQIPRQQSNDTTVLKFLIMPCGTAVMAKVFHRKTLLTTTDVYQPTVLRVNRTTPGERYLLKIMPMNIDDEIQRCKI